MRLLRIYVAPFRAGLLHPLPGAACQIRFILQLIAALHISEPFDFVQRNILMGSMRHARGLRTILITLPEMKSALE